MGDPKFIPTKKKVTYSFRIEEEKLEKLKRICELNNSKLPDLMNRIVNNYLWDKVVYNTYIENLKGMFIDLPDITKGYNYEYDIYNSNLTLEYEVKQIPCNLEYWVNILDTYEPYNKKNYEHEGIEFVIVPELCEYEERCYTDLTKYLYCIHFLVDKDYKIHIDYISFMEAINKIRKCENYPLLNHALKLKETLEKRSEEVRSQIYMNNQKGGEVSEFDFVWGEINRIANEFNTGNIVPIEKSRKDIEYKASLQSISEFDKETILKENEKLKKQLDEMNSTVEKIKKNQKEIEDIVFRDIPKEELDKIRKYL